MDTTHLPNTEEFRLPLIHKHYSLKHNKLRSINNSFKFFKILKTKNENFSWALNNLLLPSTLRFAFSVFSARFLFLHTFLVFTYLASNNGLPNKQRSKLMNLVIISVLHRSIPQILMGSTFWCYIYYETKEQGNWRIRYTYYKTDGTIKEGDIVRFMQYRRLTLVTHVERISQDRQPKKYEGNTLGIRGVRQVERPRKW